jgi:hypothetical protein
MLTTTNKKEMKTMFHNFNTFGREQQVLTNPVNNEMSVKLRMPAGYQGKEVPKSVVVMELLWQQYGLDLIHPEVSRWLEKNAPDVKSIDSKNQSASADERNNFRVGTNGTIELRLPLKLDDRLRKVSSQYILSQVETSIDPETELQMAA